MDKPSLDIKSKRKAGSSDNFLFDAIKNRPKKLSVGDGFRFGAGFLMGQLFVALIIAGLAWAAIVVFHLK